MPRAHLKTAVGAQQAEAIVLEAALDAAASLLERQDLQRPVLLVVPSQSLRLHLMARLVRHARRGAVLGVQCVTHFALALRIVGRLGLTAPRGLDLFAVLARRFARREPVLAQSLEHLRQGYSGILGAVRDLLDAGLQAAHLEAIEEALEVEGPLVASPDEISRAQALARVAAQTLAAFEQLGVGRSSTLLQTATDGVRVRPEAALHVDRVLLHGFADATGVTADFLQALLQAYGGLAVIDRPADPVAPDSVDASSTFTDRLRERLLAGSTLEESKARSSEPHIELFRALGQEAEVREVAHRCLELTAGGAPPESIGIVMRDPAPYVGLLRGVLGEFGVPFSGHGLAGPATPAGRRLRALVELAVQGNRAHVERWLDAAVEPAGGTALFDLRVALATLGIARLEELAELDLPPFLTNDNYALPVRQGFFELDEEGEGRQVVRTRRRRVSGEALRSLVEAARRLRRLFDTWSGTSLALPEHLQHLAAMVRLLEWPSESAESAALNHLVESIHQAPPIAMEQDEFAITLQRLALNAGRDEFSGRGGGVQVMGVVDARGRTFEHLFVLGMNRGVFPRTVREDPVFSDALRRLLERGGHGLLPDLPIKGRGYQEERYLFAQLLSSSPKVTLSWLEMDDADRSTPPSPLIERLRWCHPRRPESWRSPPLVGRRPLIDLDDTARPARRRLAYLPPRYQAVLSALYGRRERLGEVLPALLPHLSSHPGVRASDLAAARMAVLEEQDPLAASAAQIGLSPYLGFVGAVADDDDPRANRRLYVTLLERMATCPWQAFVERVLRVEAVPDPLEALPRIDGLLIGILVHSVLERIVGGAVPERPGDLAGLTAAAPVEVLWPEDDELDRLVNEEAVQTVRSAGIALRGFSRALAAVVRPYLETARWIDWPEGRLATLAAEIRGELDLSLPGLRRRSIAFRADRVDRSEAGLLITDYKTGTSPFTQKSAPYRYKSYLKEVRRGRRLQPVLYALAAAGGESFGRFTFLRPRFDGPEAARSVMVTSKDDDLRAAFEASTATTLRAWEEGLFFPRLEQPGEPQKLPPACRWCRVAEACLRQDSGARRRLRTGMNRLEADSCGLDDDTRRSLLDHWWLASPGQRPPETT